MFIAGVVLTVLGFVRADRGVFFFGVALQITAFVLKWHGGLCP